jgi:hypothetical protein
MAAPKRKVRQYAVYLEPAEYERFRRIVTERCVPAGALMRAAVKWALDEAETAPERLADLVRPHLRDLGHRGRTRRPTEDDGAATAPETNDSEETHEEQSGLKTTDA